MSKLSKTAKASMIGEAKEKKAESRDEAIRQIRLNLAAGLFIGDNSRVKHLLDAYDEIDQISTKSESDLAIAQADADRFHRDLITANGRIVELETAAAQRHSEDSVTTFVGEE